MQHIIQIVQAPNYSTFKNRLKTHENRQTTNKIKKRSKTRMQNRSNNLKTTTACTKQKPVNNL
jgi:hypothetical protein